MLDAIRRHLREIFGLVPVLDLHGLGVKQALVECEQFLREAQAEGIGSVKIIYGKGRRSPGGIGVLRQVVPHWLAHEGSHFVARFERALDPSGDDGGVRVWLAGSRERLRPSTEHARRNPANTAEDR